MAKTSEKKPREKKTDEAKKVVVTVNLEEISKEQFILHANMSPDDFD